MQPLTIKKVASSPEMPSDKALYLVKEGSDRFNVVLPDSSGTHPVKAIRKVALDGPTQLYESMGATQIQGVYTIKNYSAFENYTVGISAGSVTRNDNQITVTTPSASGFIYLSVNGEFSRIEVLPSYAVAPVFSYPTTGLENVPLSFTATIPDFSAVGVVDTCVQTEWQISKDPAFGSGLNFVDVGGSTSRIFSALDPLTVYYVRARQKGTLTGYSNWSVVVSFTTAAPVFGGLEKGKLLAADGVAANAAGTSVSVNASADIAVMSSYHSQVSGQTNAGAAYVFTRSGATWTFQQKLVASDPVLNANFGCSVAISKDGTVICIGAYAYTGGGAVYVFTLVGGVWTQQQRLSSSDLASGDSFGVHVAISANGDYIIASSTGDDDLFSNSGSAYVFFRSSLTWSQQQKLTASDPSASAAFGSSVSISTDSLTLAIGAKAASSSKGAVYIFTRSGATWVQQAKLTASDGVTFDNFGAAVALSETGDVLAIGAPNRANGSFTNSGGVYLFKRSVGVWSEKTRFGDSSPSSSEYFGYAVEISKDGSKILTSAYGALLSGTAYGSISYYSYDLSNTATLLYRIMASDKSAGDQLGLSLAMSQYGDYVFAGCPGDDDKGSSSGSVYLYG